MVQKPKAYKNLGASLQGSGLWARGYRIQAVELMLWIPGRLEDWRIKWKRMCKMKWKPELRRG